MQRYLLHEEWTERRKVKGSPFSMTKIFPLYDLTVLEHNPNQLNQRCEEKTDHNCVQI